jgi:hypothetical protein
MRHIVKALHIVADFGTGREVPVLDFALDSWDNFHSMLLVDSWEQMNHIARTRWRLVLIREFGRTQDSQVLELLVALKTPE